MDAFLVQLPDKIVADDIINYLTKKTDKHLFSDIYRGRTALRPNDFIEYGYKDIIHLYEGGLGMGNYIRVSYSVKENKYIYYTMNANEEPREAFTSDNWSEFHSHVRIKLLDLFVWFNTHSMLENV